MAKASIRLPNGTSVLIEGTPDEVRHLLEFYGQSSGATPDVGIPKRKKRSTKKIPASSSTTQTEGKDKPNLAEIINLVKNVDEAEAIESRILDRTSQVNRILLPLYIVHEHLGNAFGLSTGEVSKISADLGIPIQQPNVSGTLTGTASRYVMGDRVRKRGQAVRYKLSRRGLRYITAVLEGKEDGE